MFYGTTITFMNDIPLSAIALNYTMHSCALLIMVVVIPEMLSLTAF